MSRSIRVSDTLLEEAEKAATLCHRSPPQQIEHWAQLGRIMESALSWPAQIEAKSVSLHDRLAAGLSSVDTPAGRKKSLAVIQRTSKHPRGYD